MEGPNADVQVEKLVSTQVQRSKKTTKDPKTSSLNQSQNAGKPRLSKEQLETRRQEAMDRKISMAKERNSRVARIESSMGNISFNILQQFDPAYNKVLGKLGAFPIPELKQRVEDYLTAAQDLIIQLSDLTEKMCQDAEFRYFMPQDLKVIKEYYRQQKKQQDPQLEEIEKNN